MKALLAIPAMLIAMNVAAECPAERPIHKPELDVNYASSEAELLQAQNEAKSYIADVVTFINCRGSHLSTLEHNFFVESAYSMAEEYNEVLRAYKQSQEAVASN